MKMVSALDLDSEDLGKVGERVAAIMVLKKSKHLANTGNTLRRSTAACHSKTARFLSKTSKLPGIHEVTSKQSLPSREVKVEWVRDRNLKAGSEVWYSLNKDKRWTMPSEIEEQLQETKNCSWDLESVSWQAIKRKQKPVLGERRDRDTKRARTVLVESPGNWLFGNHKVRKPYAFMDSEECFLKRKSCKSGKENNPPYDGDIVYEVMQPVHSYHWPYHADGSVFNRAANGQNQHLCNRKGAYKHQDLNLKYDVNEYYNCMEDAEKVESAEEKMESALKDPAGGRCFAESYSYMDLQSLIDVAMLQKKKGRGIRSTETRPDLRSATRAHGKGDFIVFVQRDQSLQLQDANDHANPTTSPVESGEKSYGELDADAVLLDETSSSVSDASEINVTRVFRKDEMRKDILSEQYGHLYQEAGTERRAFAIFAPNCGVGERVFSSALLFSAKDSQLSRRSDVEKWSIRSFGFVRKSGLKPKRNNADFKTFVGSLIFPRSSSLKSKSGKQVSDATESLAIPRLSLSHQGSIVHRLHAVFEEILRSFEREETSSKEKLTMDVLEYQQLTDEKLDIESFESVCPVCLDPKANDAFTRLLKCGHQACSKCWSQYLSDKLSDGRFPTCPVVNCSVKVDIVTMMLLIDSKSIAVFLRNVCEQKILSSGNAKVCPNSDCANFATVVRRAVSPPPSKLVVDTPVVSCSCGQRWCFCCHKRAHWPASCKAVAVYELFEDEGAGKLFDDRGQFFQTEVFVKRCPYCFVFIDKWTGCSHVVCRCGKSFCWSCGKGIKDHGSVACMEIAATAFTFSSLDDVGGGHVSRYLSKALKYRVESDGVRSLSRDREMGKLVDRVDVREHRSRLIAAKRSVLLLEDCYGLLEYVMVAKAMCSSRHRNARLTRFELGLKSRLETMRRCLEVKQLKDLNVGRLVVLSRSIHEYLLFLK